MKRRTINILSTQTLEALIAGLTVIAHRLVLSLDGDRSAVLALLVSYVVALYIIRTWIAPLTFSSEQIDGEHTRWSSTTNTSQWSPFEIAVLIWLAWLAAAHMTHSHDDLYMIVYQLDWIMFTFSAFVALLLHSTQRQDVVRMIDNFITHCFAIACIVHTALQCESCLPRLTNANSSSLRVALYFAVVCVLDAKLARGKTDQDRRTRRVTALSAWILFLPLTMIIPYGLAVVAIGALTHNAIKLHSADDATERGEQPPKTLEWNR